jgi:hypothetical protein
VTHATPRTTGQIFQTNLIPSVDRSHDLPPPLTKEHVMPSYQTRALIQYLSAVAAVLVALTVASPAFAQSLTCSSERFTAGKRTMPSYDEAMAECMAQETAMTNPESGAFSALRSCHEIGSKGNHGPWLHGRIGVDVVERSSGERYTFEGLWMCKPVAEVPASTHRR